MVVEDVARRIVIVGVIHTPAHGGVVIAQDRHRRKPSHFVAAFVGLGTIADDVA